MEHVGIPDGYSILILIGILIGFFICAVIQGCLLKFLWFWVIEDIFPGAVKQGLIAESISWYSAIFITFIIDLILGIAIFAITPIVK